MSRHPYQPQEKLPDTLWGWPVRIVVLAGSLLIYAAVLTGFLRYLLG